MSIFPRILQDGEMAQGEGKLDYMRDERRMNESLSIGARTGMCMDIDVCAGMDGERNE